MRGENFILAGVRAWFHVIDVPGYMDDVEIGNYRSDTSDDNKYLIETQILEEIDNGRYKIVSEKPRIVPTYSWGNSQGYYPGT